MKCACDCTVVSGTTAQQVSLSTFVFWSCSGGGLCNQFFFSVGSHFVDVSSASSSFLLLLFSIIKLGFEKGWGTFRSSRLFMWSFCFCHRFMPLLNRGLDYFLINFLLFGCIFYTPITFCAIYSSWIHSTCTIFSINPLEMNFIKLSLIPSFLDWHRLQLSHKMVITSQSDGRNHQIKEIWWS